MDYKMVVSDLDGTMFDGSFKAGEKNIASIKKLTDAGLVFAIASGRPAISVLPIAHSLGMGENQYIICFNGALIAEAVSQEPVKTIYSLPLSNTDSLHLIKNARDKGATILAYIDGRPYTHYDDIESKKYSNHVGVTITVDKNFEDIYTGDYNKVLVKGAPESLKRIEEELSEWASGRVSSTYSSVNLLEYFSKDASKGTAMLFLAEKLGIKREETIAIGDFDNDISMLAAAGLGVAIKDAPKSVTSVTGYVTERAANEGAVAEVIEKFIFGK